MKRRISHMRRRQDEVTASICVHAKNSALLAPRARSKASGLFEVNMESTAYLALASLIVLEINRRLSINQFCGISVCWDTGDGHPGVQPPLVDTFEIIPLKR
jgi:hypothetical protein